MHHTIIAIDPGSKGYITVLRDGTQLSHFSIADLSPQQLADTITSISDRDTIAVMEEVHAVFGSSAKATFNFGKVNGLLLGIIIANRIPYHLVQPKEWQKEIWINEDKVYKRGASIDTKATSLHAAQRLYPGLDFKRSTRCTKPDDNLIDSLLIAHYALRKNL